MLNIGITTRAFREFTVADTAQRMAAGGFKCTELCFVHPDLNGWTYNGIGSLDGVTPALVKEAAGQFRYRGVDVVSLGMFTDLRNPEESARAAAVDYAKRYIEFAAEAGIPVIATECGFTPGAHGLNADTYDSDYAHLKETIREICLLAEKSGVHLALEASAFDIIPSPRRMKTLIEELEEECHVRLGALLDPANLLPNTDEDGMFYYLKHDVAYIHGKDRKINALRGTILGEGDVDYLKFMSCYIRFTDRKPFILEHCDKDDCLTLKKRAEDIYDEAFQNLLSRIN